MNKLYRNYKLKVAFSKAAPQDACPSAGRLLHCALLPIRAKCGLEAADFVREYVTRFTAAVDPKCVLDNKSNKTSATAISPSSISSKGGAASSSSATNILPQGKKKRDFPFQHFYFSLKSEKATTKKQSKMFSIFLPKFSVPGIDLKKGIPRNRGGKSGIQIAFISYLWIQQNLIFMFLSFYSFEPGPLFLCVA